MSTNLKAQSYVNKSEGPILYLCQQIWSPNSMSTILRSQLNVFNSEVPTQCLQFWGPNSMSTILRSQLNVNKYEVPTQCQQISSPNPNLKNFQKVRRVDNEKMTKIGCCVSLLNDGYNKAITGIFETHYSASFNLSYSICPKKMSPYSIVITSVLLSV